MALPPCPDGQCALSLKLYVLLRFREKSSLMPSETAHLPGFVLFSRDTNYTYFLSLCLSIVPAAGNPRCLPHVLNPLGNSLLSNLLASHRSQGRSERPPCASSANQSKKGVWDLAL